MLEKLKENAVKALKADEGSPVANRALELIGRHQGMFRDEAAVVVNTVNPGLQPLDGDALAALLTKEDKSDDDVQATH